MLAKIVLSALALAAACVNAQDNAPAQVSWVTSRLSLSLFVPRLTTLPSILPHSHTHSGNPVVIRFLCPLTDKSDFPLETFNYAYTAKSYFCSYPSFPGENPFNFYCLYNQKTGALAQDSNVGEWRASFLHLSPLSFLFI